MRQLVLVLLLVLGVTAVLMVVGLFAVRFGRELYERRRVARHGGGSEPQDRGDPAVRAEIRPILQRQCQGCHQPNLKSSNLDLTTYEGLAAGG